MIQIYCGDGKGKTTAAMGQAVRAAGRGMGVVIAQFLKSADSGERFVLGNVPGVTLLPAPEQVKFTFAMDSADRESALATHQRLLTLVQQALESGAQLAVLDEVCAAISTHLLPLEQVTALLDAYPDREFVLTGRDPAEALTQRADYITEMRLVRHPFEKGMDARRGIEF